MKKLIRLLGRKLRFILPTALVYLFVAAGSAFAQSATLTATVRVNPLKVKVITLKPVTVGEWFEIPVAVSNLDSETITKTVATIHGSPKLAIKGKRERIGNLDSGKETIIWLAKANRPGNFVIQVEVTGELSGEEISASDTTIIPAIGSLGAFFFRLIFGV